MNVKDFVLAGNATFTVAIAPEDRVLAEGREYYTYRVRYKEAQNGHPATYFVNLLTGPDNTSDYTYMGMLKAETGHVVATRASKYNEGSAPLRVLNYVLNLVWGNKALPMGYEVKHTTKCGKCGRPLTTIESLDRGIGPECWSRMPHPPSNATSLVMPRIPESDQEPIEHEMKPGTIVDRLRAAQAVAAEEAGYDGPTTADVKKATDERVYAQYVEQMDNKLALDVALSGEAIHVVPLAVFSQHDGIWATEASTTGFAHPGGWPGRFLVLSGKVAYLVERDATPDYVGKGEDREVAGFTYRCGQTNVVFKVFKVFNT